MMQLAKRAGILPLILCLVATVNITNAFAQKADHKHDNHSQCSGGSCQEAGQVCAEEGCSEKCECENCECCQGGTCGEQGGCGEQGCCGEDCTCENCECCSGGCSGVTGQAGQGSCGEQGCCGEGGCAEGCDCGGCKSKPAQN